ncbi:MAG TPA: methionyl-tRNA formyltransferase [bacterium]|nr:methionyl-tRNA formyltransferase [bacterium]
MARYVFMGSPEIAVPSLQALQAAGHEGLAVVTQPDKPKGRGQVLSPPAVKVAAETLGLKVLQPQSLKANAEFAEELRGFKPELILVVAYGKILPAEILGIPEICCVNLHFSLLPKYRGASCVAYPLIEGREESGVTTIVMDEGLDTGPILLQWSEPILPADTAGTLSARLAELGAQALVQTVAGLERGNIHPTPQNEAEASFAPLLRKEEGRVDWSRPAPEIYNRYRGLSPWPGAFTFLDGKRIVLSELALYPEAAAAKQPGTLETGPEGRILVATGQGNLELRRLKPEGKSVLSAADFMRGWTGKDPVFS